MRIGVDQQPPWGSQSLMRLIKRKLLPEPGTCNYQHSVVLYLSDLRGARFAVSRTLGAV